MFKLLLNKYFIFPLVALSTVGIFSLSSVSAVDTAVFRTGDILTGGDRSFPSCDWCDPVTAGPGHAIEFRMMVQNMVPDTTATNVKVTANLPTTPQNSPLVGSATASADNAASVSDNLTVNFEGSQQAFAYIDGHARVFSLSCPNGCSAPDTVTSSGINVGNLAYGDSAQVAWKAYVTNFEQPQPSPSPSIVPSPSPSVMPSPSPSPSVVPSPSPSAPPPSSPPAGTTNNNCTGSNSCSGTANATATVTTTPAVAGTSTSTLPKTGLPLLAWTALAFTPMGARLKKFGKKKNEIESASFLWEDREFKKAY